MDTLKKIAFFGIGFINGIKQDINVRAAIDEGGLEAFLRQSKREECSKMDDSKMSKSR
jgi:hypothetical protein